jgi:UDP-glucose 4-epimerase
MELKGKSVMVTGGAGFIGSHLVDRLVEEEPSRIVVCSNMFLGSRNNLAGAEARFDGIKLYVVDVADYDAVLEIVKDDGVDVVFNLAVIPLPTSLEKPEWTIEENVRMTTSICRLARCSSPRRKLMAAHATRPWTSRTRSTPRPRTRPARPPPTT